jgi:hypothetical protein
MESFAGQFNYRYSPLNICYPCYTNHAGASIGPWPPPVPLTLKGDRELGSFRQNVPRRRSAPLRPSPASAGIRPKPPEPVLYRLASFRQRTHCCALSPIGFVSPTPNRRLAFHLPVELGSFRQLRKLPRPAHRARATRDSEPPPRTSVLASFRQPLTSASPSTYPPNWVRFVKSSGRPLSPNPHPASPTPNWLRSVELPCASPAPDPRPPAPTRPALQLTSPLPFRYHSLIPWEVT